MFACLNDCTVFQIGLGCLSSLIVWWLINIVLSPRLKIENEIQYPKKSKKYVRVKNWTCFNAYDVCFTIEYSRKGNKLDSYISTGTIIPSIERGETYFLELKSKSDDEHKCVETFFTDQNEKNTLVITAVYQSKIGIKKRKTRTIRFNKERFYV